MSRRAADTRRAHTFEKPVIISLLSVGLVSILAQVVVLRELAVAFYGVELIYILAMAVWLLWTAVGAVIGRWSHAGSGTVVGYLFVLFAVLLPADVALIRALRSISGGVPGAYLSFGVQMLGLFVTLFPVAFLLGLLFQWTARTYIGGGRTLARAYAIESAGGILGGLASTLLLHLGIQNFTIAVLCGALALTTVFVAGRPPDEIVARPAPGATPPEGRGARAAPRGFVGNRARVAAAFTAPVVLALVAFGPRLDDGLTRINHPALVASSDSPYSRVTLTRQGEQFVVFENDALAFETQNVTADEFVHIAATHADSLRRVLVLGGGIEGLVTELLQYAPSRIDYVELNPVLLSLARTSLPRVLWEPLESERVDVVVDDPRRFVKETASRYDLVLVAMPDPASGHSNRFYTMEFFAECAGVIAPRGVLALRLPSSENIWTPFLTYRNASIFRALEGVFEDAVVLPGSTNIVIASSAPLPRDPALLGARLEARGVTTRLVTPRYVSYLYTNDRFSRIAAALSAAEVPPNTDLRPVCYRYAGMIWLSKFFPRLITAEMGSDGASARRTIPWTVAALALLCALFILCRRHRRFQRIVVAALAGFIGMVLETALILHYQVKSGVLFQNLGLLLMAFMAGLAAGAAAVPYFARSDGSKPLQNKTIWGRWLFIAFSAVNLAALVLMRTGIAGLPAVSLLIFLGGALVSGLFAYASLLGDGDQRALVSPLYAADLVGGCAGSLVGSLFLVPFLGLGETAAAMVLVALAALLSL